MSSAPATSFAQAVARKCGGSNITGLVKANGTEKKVKFDPMLIMGLISAIIPVFGMCKKRQETPPDQVQAMVRQQHEKNALAQRREWAKDIVAQSKAKCRDAERAYKRGGPPVDYGMYSLTQESASELAAHSIDHFLSLTPEEATALVSSQTKA